jgi:phenylacetate-CoA ligase
MDVLHLPLKELAAFSMRRLTDLKTLEKASKSILYREKWKTAGIQPEKIETYDDFAKLPFITSKELRETIAKGPIEEVLCSEVVHWFCTTGTTGNPKWIPYGRKDIELFMEIRDRSASILPSMEDLRGFAVSGPPPFVEDGLANLNMIRQMLTHTELMDSVTICLTEVEHEDPIDFALDIKPNIIISFPGFAARFAEIVEENAPEVARKRFRERRSLRNLAAHLVTRVKKIRPRDLSKFEWGLFGGEPLDPYRQVLTEGFGLEAYEMYLFTEFMPPALECRMHEGMHLWMDICLPEIIPEEELDRETVDNSYVPKAVPLWEAEDGLRGEYVLTTSGEALPLVRYRFGDLIEVVSTKPCRCGITHPRIKVPRRSDATICLGAIRFPAAKLEEILLRPTKYGAAQRWQLEIVREGYHPKPIIRVEPSREITNKELFLTEISKRLGELEILRTGVKNKLVVEPTLILEDRLKERGRFVAKAGRIIYEGETA